jgi:hypothetical protein
MAHGIYRKPWEGINFLRRMIRENFPEMMTFEV